MKTRGAPHFHKTWRCASEYRGFRFYEGYYLSSGSDVGVMFCGTVVQDFHHIRRLSVSPNINGTSTTVDATPSANRGSYFLVVCHQSPLHLLRGGDDW